MAQIAQIAQVEEGNTITSSAKKKVRRYCLTLNNYSIEEHTNLKNWIAQKNTLFIIGKEIGENNTPHLQCYLELKHPMTFTALKKALGDRYHIEATKKSKAVNIAYCSKEEDYETNFRIRKPLKDKLKNLELRPFQQEILEIIKTDPDDRTIHWYYEEEGNVGKTTLAKHLAINMPNEFLLLGGKGSDIKYGVFSFLENPENELKVCIFHFTRSTENFISYEALEAIKDGLFYNTKYKSGMCVFNSPHIICLANFEPNQNKLSPDRWNIRDIATMTLPL